MATELVTFKMEHEFLNEVDATAKVSGYQSRTEFIRAALRDKIDELKMKQAIIELSRMRGKSKIKTTDKQRRAAREKVFEKIDKMLK
jgi:metal-responsive CopG/Arc/MetJ family transcriptional regulator